MGVTAGATMGKRPVRAPKAQKKESSSPTMLTTSIALAVIVLSVIWWLFSGTVVTVAPVKTSAPPRTAPRAAVLPESPLTSSWADRWASDANVTTALISESPRVQLHRSFLTQEEVSALAELHLSDDKGYLNDDGTGVRVRHWTAGDVDQSASLQQFERKVAAVTGMPWDDRSGVQSREQRVVDAHPHNNNLHLDIHQKPLRVATVIAYLKDVDRGDTGFTAFPCLLPPGTAADIVEARRELCTDATATGATSYVAQKGTEASGRGVSYRMLQLAAGVCDGSIAGVRIKPAAGSAVMFEYNQGDAADAGLLWHLGCDIEGTSGQISEADSTKLCIQKFKEVPVPNQAPLWKKGQLSQFQTMVVDKIELFDKDDDLQLNLSELAAFLQANGSGLSVTEYMASCDVNGDGMLDVYEGAFHLETHMTNEPLIALWLPA